MKCKLLALTALSFLAVSAVAQRKKISEISVDIKMDMSTYVSGERVRGVVDIKNISPDRLSVGYPDS
ncbi:MAG: hypothetical protein J6V38_06005, partial [Kiritimatiellae bacterium]|nr:hypothetical protein [Kiritimatiellia bacterium]